MRTKKEEEETKTWGIPNFPVRLRQKFVGKNKMEGNSTTEVMVKLITNELKKEDLLK